MNTQIRKDKSLPEACRDCSNKTRTPYSAACPSYGALDCGLFFKQHSKTELKKENIMITEKTEHTPGKWEIGKSLEKQFIIGRRNGREAIIAGDLYDENNEPTIKELDANAALIAAGPELLAALGMFVACKYEDRAGLCSAHMFARAAIAKAKGQ